MNQEFDVLTIGNAIVDVIAKVDDAFVAREKLVKGSMNLIDEDRAETLYSHMGPASEHSGGSAGNTAAGVASFGGRAAYIGKVRDDQLGGIFAHDLKAIGVHFGTAKSKTGPATARSFILVTPDGERTMNTYLGACVNLSPADIDPQVVKAAKVTYMEGYLFDKPEAKAAFRQAAQVARSAGRKTSITLSDTFCVDRHRADWLALIRSSIDIVFANEGELQALYEVSDFDAALTAMRKDVALAAVTRGEHGATIVHGAETVHVPAFPIRKMVDATGAGDLFAAGFLFGHTRGLALKQSAALGCLAAAECIQQIGPRPEKNLAALAARHKLI